MLLLVLGVVDAPEYGALEEAHPGPPTLVAPTRDVVPFCCCI